MIRVYVSTKDRKDTTEKCLRRMREVCDYSNAILTVVDDYSEEYDLEWLKQFADIVERSCTNANMTPQQRLLSVINQQLMYFQFSNEPYCYLTDNDCYHHIDALEVAKTLAKYKEPVGLYISKHNIPNKLEPPFYKLNSGVSLFFSRFDRFYPFARDFLAQKTLNKWDGTLFRAYRATGGKFAIPEYSMLEHLGEGGVNYRPNNIDVAQNLHPDLIKELYG